MRSVVQLDRVRRSYGATRALSDVSFDLQAGEVHALIGENGAGKSTLMSILSGVLQPDAGEIRIGGAVTVLRSRQEANVAGIATVFQELSLVGGLTVEENICAGRPPTRNGLVDRAAMRDRARRALARLNLPVAPGRRVDGLMASQRQGVEIAKALDQLFHPARSSQTNPLRVLILDEPTSALNVEEKQALFAAVRALRAEGVGVIYISHHLDEVIALADRITVLRDGASVWTRPVAEVTTDGLVRAMVGRDVERGQRQRGQAGAVAVRFEAVSVAGLVQDITLDLREGEIVAVAGLDGSGRETVARLLAGIQRRDRGEITLWGKPHPGNLRAAMARGVAYVPDDRKTLGLFLQMSIAANTLAADLAAATRFGLVQDRRQRDEANVAIKRHDIKAPDARVAVGSLSGGNQQKVLMAKWLRRAPRVLVVEEPTKGVDIGAKLEIHDEIVALARQGAAVLIASSDLPEVLELADRILVMHRGRIVGQIEGNAATEEAVMELAAGPNQSIAS